MWLLGFNGPYGFSARSTAEQVTQGVDGTGLTTIVTVRIGVIYLLSAITGSMVAALFLQDTPTVTSSGSLFGLLGTMFSALIQNWKNYSKKSEAFGIFFFILLINILLGLLPYVNNFSNIGGFFCGFLLGFVHLFKPDLRKLSQSKAGLFEYEVKHSFQLRQRLDKPVLRIVFLVLFIPSS